MIEWLTALLIFQYSPLDVYRNNAGLSLLQEEESQARAVAYYTKLLQEHPDQNYYLWNLSSSYMANGQWEAAKKTLDYFVGLLKENDSEDFETKNWLFYSYYNLAKVYQQEEDMAKALAYYEKALSIHPLSKEVTVNIELLLQNQEGGGQGQGEQDQEENNDDKNQEDGDQENEEQENKEEQKPESQPTPKPYEGQDLSKEDVRRILEELKRQEEEIRGKVQEKEPKQRPDGKDW